jgi:hypothetical protein
MTPERAAAIEAWKAAVAPERTTPEVAAFRIVGSVPAAP